MVLALVVPKFDASRFSGIENQDCFVIRANNTVLAETDLDPHFDVLYHFRELFAKMGWNCILNLP